MSRVATLILVGLGIMSCNTGLSEQYFILFVERLSLRQVLKGLVVRYLCADLGESPSLSRLTARIHPNLVELSQS